MMPSLEETFIQTVGEGENTVVLHGGPGFSHRYLVRHLSFLSANKRLVFFDQLGCGRTGGALDELTFRSMSDHAARVLCHFSSGGTVRVVAHSFGVAVLLGALETLPDLKINGLLLNAVPTNKDGFDRMRNDLFARMEPDLLEALANAATVGLDQEQLARMLPYYVSPSSQPDLKDLSFDFSAYNRVYQSLDGFDVSHSVYRLRDCSLILGSDDFINPESISDIRTACKSQITIGSAGHFPFAEQPDAFQVAARDMLSSQ